MGHYLHFLVTVAEDGEAAAGIVENHLVGHGDENNWRTAFAAVNHAGETWFEKDTWNDESMESKARSWMGGMGLSWASIAELLNAEVRPEEDLTPLLDKVEQMRGKKLSEMDSLDLYGIGKRFKELSERRDVAKFVYDEDNLHTAPDFWMYTFDELGITHIDSYEIEEAELGEVWIVLLDWHE